MTTSTKRGFSLVELIVVIGIIVVLAAVLIGALSGSSDSALAARCLTNMKNLASACQAYGLQTDYYPLAGSTQYFVFDRSRGKRAGRARLKYYENKGWVSWYSQGQFPMESKGGAPQTVPMYWSAEAGEGIDHEGLYAITNGAVWRYTSGSREVYTCPVHKKMYGNARWSYLMNAYFGWNIKGGEYSYGQYQGREGFAGLAKPDRVLLFSEVPFDGPGHWRPKPGDGGTDEDGVLQFDTCGQNSATKGETSAKEHIGFNHKSGRKWYAHVVFADGHVEKIVAPTQENQFYDLTKWLCTGTDYSFDGRNYREMTN